MKLAIAIGMLVFSGLLWPWVLTAMHKKSVRRCFEQILNDVNAGCSDTRKSKESIQ